jgi:hypothetical protein
VLGWARPVTSTSRTIRRGGRRIAEWSIVILSLAYALLFVRFEWGGAAAYLLALLPCLLAYVVARTLLASAFMFLLPMYFVIGQWTAGWPHYQPYIDLDHAMPVRPAWMFVYGSLYMTGFLLPLVVVRGRELFQQTLKAYLFVMVVSYAGFVMYPTVAPRNENVAVTGFAEWSLKLFYDLDQPYGCFPSLHVAYSFVGALACYRMHRGVGAAAAAWAALIWSVYRLHETALRRRCDRRRAHWTAGVCDLPAPPLATHVKRDRPATRPAAGALRCRGLPSRSRDVLDRLPDGTQFRLGDVVYSGLTLWPS